MTGHPEATGGDEDKISLYDGSWRTIYDGFNEADRNRRRVSQLLFKPTDNSDPVLNDGEVRLLPKELKLHPSVRWFSDPPKNTIRMNSPGTPVWTFPFYKGTE